MIGIMKNTSRADIEGILKRQKEFFSEHRTKNVTFRLQQLEKLKSAILKYETKITGALWNDLHKSPEEVYMTEISILFQEINNHIKHLKKWAKPQRVSTPIHLLPSKSQIIYEPLGVVLIIAPWNYPFQLLMNPLVGAVSTGCCAVLKPSPYTPATATIMEEMIAETFSSDYIGIVQGNREVNHILLEQRFDLIFFTGSPALAKNVMKAASEHLTPVVLELGGKSPCIVDKEANIDIAAKRIAWGKTINSGQTCIAPDYLFIHRSVKDLFIERYKKTIANMYGNDCKQSKYYPRIVNAKAMERLKKLLLDGHIVFGGEFDDKERYISPTLIDDIKPEHAIMQEEIFGPILPVMTFDHISQVIDYVNSHEKPLALYYFGKNRKSKDILLQTTSGGGCINDTLMHITNHNLPFGGIGNSGMGKYHGKESFLAFSNKRAIVNSPVWFDMTVKYAPFKHFGKIKKFIS
jgi:aldehyde dehydrogenase (NAD+)